MRIAFYAPMKAPDHPNPSGDRAMARQLMRALRFAGHEVILVSRLRARDGRGDAQAQARLNQLARQEVANLSARLLEDPPDVWFTYHLYYKAPDLIGPKVCAALGIPYVVAEASHSEKQLSGPYAGFAAQAVAAIQQASAVICITARDRAGLTSIVPADRLFQLKPFVPGRPRPARRHQRGPLRLLAVGMMRFGDKLESYRQLAVALRRLSGQDWTLTIVGDGEAAQKVRSLFTPLRGQVRFVGKVNAQRLNSLYGIHDLCIWPAVNEAYGMALLEASAHGLPVLAGDEGGVRDVIQSGRNGLLVSRRDPFVLARTAQTLMRDRKRLNRLQSQSWKMVERGHRLTQASRSLNTILEDLC